MKNDIQNIIDSYIIEATGCNFWVIFLTKSSICFEYFVKNKTQKVHLVGSITLFITMHSQHSNKFIVDRVSMQSSWMLYFLWRSQTRWLFFRSNWKKKMFENAWCKIIGIYIYLTLLFCWLVINIVDTLTL